VLCGVRSKWDSGLSSAGVGIGPPPMPEMLAGPVIFRPAPDGSGAASPLPRRFYAYDGAGREISAAILMTVISKAYIAAVLLAAWA
jgi:hypothetical protein